ncbi:MAG: hypothetical protein L0154_16585 [Chloroflexi bacterium]|nr:hypothetical protein [Chloroflexota bacterium]
MKRLIFIILLVVIVFPTSLQAQDETGSNPFGIVEGYWRPDTAHNQSSLGSLGEKDVIHLERATSMGRILCTYDSDFLRLAATGYEHAGIVYAPRQKIGIGSWVRGIRALHGRLVPEDAVNNIYYLP